MALMLTNTALIPNTAAWYYKRYPFLTIKEWENKVKKGRVSKTFKRAIDALIRESRKNNKSNFTELSARIKLAHPYKLGKIQMKKLIPVSPLLNGGEHKPRVKTCESFTKDKETGILKGVNCESAKSTLSKKAHDSAWTALMWYANNICVPENKDLAETRVKWMKRIERVAEKLKKGELTAEQAELYEYFFDEVPPYGRLYKIFQDYLKPIEFDEVALALNIVYKGKSKKSIDYRKSQLVIACHTNESVLTFFQSDDGIILGGYYATPKGYEPTRAILNLAPFAKRSKR